MYCEYGTERRLRAVVTNPGFRIRLPECKPCLYHLVASDLEPTTFLSLASVSSWVKLD